MAQRPLPTVHLILKIGYGKAYARNYQKKELSFKKTYRHKPKTTARVNYKMFNSKKISECVKELIKEDIKISDRSQLDTETIDKKMVFYITQEKESGPNLDQCEGSRDRRKVAEHNRVRPRHSYGHDQQGDLQVKGQKATRL